MESLTQILQKYNRLSGIDFTMFVIGSRKDNGDEQWFNRWKVLGPSLSIVGFEPDQEACDMANRSSQHSDVPWREIHYPLALGATEGDKILYVTDDPACSSIYQPNLPFTSRYRDLNSKMNIKTELPVTMTTVNHFCAKNKIQNVDILLLDVQGSELDVIKGASSVISSVLSVIVEVEFSQIYKDQPLFSDIDVVLRQNQLSLFDLAVHNRHLPRAASPIQGIEFPGQLLWGDATYLKDLFLINDDKVLTASPSVILKLVCIADILGFIDYSLEIAEHLTMIYGISNNKYNLANEIVIALAQVQDLVSYGLKNVQIIRRIYSQISDECLYKFNLN